MLFSTTSAFLKALPVSVKKHVKYSRIGHGFPRTGTTLHLPRPSNSRLQEMVKTKQIECKMHSAFQSTNVLETLGHLKSDACNPLATAPHPNQRAQPFPSPSFPPRSRPSPLHGPKSLWPREPVATILRPLFKRNNSLVVQSWLFDFSFFPCSFFQKWPNATRSRWLFPWKKHPRSTGSLPSNIRATGPKISFTKGRSTHRQSACKISGCFFGTAVPKIQ
jgi:hypothetical protein